MNTALVISLCMAWHAPPAQAACLYRHELVLLTPYDGSNARLADFRALDAALTTVVRGR